MVHHLREGVHPCTATACCSSQRSQRSRSLRARDGSLDRDVAFFYSVAHESDAVYLDEIERAAGEHPTVVPHVVVADRDGFLTAPRGRDGEREAAVGGEAEGDLDDLIGIHE